MLPVTLDVPVVFKFCATTLPDAENAPGVVMLPPVILPVTVRLPRVPTVVKLETVTFELKVLPVIRAAVDVSTTLLIKLPSPTNLPPVTTFPVAETTPFPVNCP
jgi:hypothetical protein